ncbi:jupiter microtubule associated homolog 2 [Megalops cyprinoides]|uniref:jupiter microtubule associated homolog 2 n=1 Tax=Megalops cyprinoides TaxID=118141 RepID=UPI001863E67E|nr:jupiter microtubule associated homolog 2 [Megalops cyprinoides]
MTSTNMYQGLDEDAKPSSRVLRPPGGGSSNLFGGCDEEPSVRRPAKSSNIFASPEEPQECPRRTNPPGGKSSGIFEQPGALAPQQRAVPPGGVSSNIFGPAESNPLAVRSYPSKPKDNIGINATPAPQVPEQTLERQAEKENTSASPVPSQDTSCSVQEKETSPHKPTVEDHEPRLGPRPRSHNKVIQPPGGKSSVVFY